MRSGGSPSHFSMQLKCTRPSDQSQGLPFPSYFVMLAFAGRKGILMARPRHLSESRLREILRRQDPPKWGRDYDPAIRATREEAPSRSRPAQVWSNRLGRYCHVLSAVEQKALLLVLYHPALFELHEQRMLATESSPHPLAGHTHSVGLSFPHFRGTVSVCERLDAIPYHPRVSVDRPDGGGRIEVPFPFIGDFLLYLADSAGPYCVNWTVKGHKSEFRERKILADRPSRSPEKERAKIEMRHAIEERYYLDAGIRTVRIADRDMPDDFILNLRSLLVMIHKVPEIEPAAYTELCERLQASVGTRQSPIDILLSMVHRYDLPLEVLRASFALALWKRDVRAELMSDAIFLDLPLQRERQDPLQLFAGWFSRNAD